MYEGHPINKSQNDIFLIYFSQAIPTLQNKTTKYFVDSSGKIFIEMFESDGVANLESLIVEQKKTDIYIAFTCLQSRNLQLQKK